MESEIIHTQLIAARGGDETALAAIITQEMPTIRHYAKKVTGPGLDFEDAVQEGVIGLFNALANYEENREVTFATYANVCIHNAVISAKKAASRKKHAPLNYSVPIPETESTPGPEEQAIANEQVALALEKARTRLSSFELTVLALHLDGLSYDEISSTLNKTPKAVENALGRARRKLK